MTTNSRGGFVRTEENAQLDSEALKLRSNGLTYREIAELLGVDPSTAYRRVKRALSSVVAEAVEEHRSLELLRLDSLHAALWSKALEGNLSAVKGILSIMERRSKLLGLDAPQKQETALQQWTVTDIDREVQRLERLLAENPDYE